MFRGIRRVLFGSGGGPVLAVPVPVLGAELLTDGGLENWESTTNLTSWIEAIASDGTINREGTTKHGGTYATRFDIAAAGNAIVVYQSTTLEAGTWFNASWWARSSVAAKTHSFLSTASGGVGPLRNPGDTWVQYIETRRVVTANPNVGFGNTTGATPSGSSSLYLDDASIMSITLASMFSTRAYFTHATTKAKATVVSGTRAGVVANLDSATSPANFVIASHDGTTARLTKCVAGTYTDLISEYVAYSAGAYVEIRRVLGTNLYQLWYDNAQVAGSVNIDDAGIINNTLCGYFNTYAGNTLTDFSCAASTDLTASVATYTVTTTGAATHTIAALTVSASTVVDWGDGSTSTYTGAGARTHDYAGAGTWTVTVRSPLNVTALTLSENTVTLNSAQIKTMTNMLLFTAASCKAGRFDSADVAAWRPQNFYLSQVAAGYTGTFNSADVSAWRPAEFYLLSMPVAMFIITITANGFANYTGCNNFQMQGNSFSAAQVNAILWDLYQAAIAPRTATGGTINVAGTNAAPSGTYQACASPPVSAATPGKEIAHELINDTQNQFTNHWATVTTS